MSDYGPTANDETFDDLPEVPKWPKVVGIVSVVLGSLGLICNGCGAAYMFGSEQILKMAEPQMGPAPSVMIPSPVLTVVVMISFLWAILLLIAGILSIARNPTTRMTHLVYAVGGLLIVGVATYLQMEQQAAMTEWARQNPDNPWAQNADSPMAVVSLYLGVVLGATWPIFCLIWFGVVKTRREQITGGVEAVA